MNRADRRAEEARNRKRPELAELVPLLRLVAVAGGCTCEPDITITAGGLVGIAHDSWCGHRHCPAGCKCALCQAVAGGAQ